MVRMSLIVKKDESLDPLHTDFLCPQTGSNEAEWFLGLGQAALVFVSWKAAPVGKYRATARRVLG
jgi:hypothetical protein